MGLAGGTLCGMGTKDDRWRTMQSVDDKVTPDAAANCFRHSSNALGIGVRMHSLRPNQKPNQQS